MQAARGGAARPGTSLRQSLEERRGVGGACRRLISALARVKEATSSDP